MTDGEAASTKGGDLDDHAIGPIGSRWTSCGLWESAGLALVGDLEIADPVVPTSFRGGRIDIEATVANRAPAARTAMVRALP